MTRINLKTGQIIPEKEFSGPTPERELQKYVEKYLFNFFNSYHLKSFYKIPGGEIDTLAITEDGNPCIIEFKHKVDDKILNQIVFYYDWLQSKSVKFEFERIVNDNPKTNNIPVDWSKIRLITVAKKYSKWDISLIKHLDTNIECFTYSYHEDELDIHLDPISISSSYSVVNSSPTTLENHRSKADEKLLKYFDLLREKVLSLGDDVEEGYTPEYIKYSVKTIFLELHIQKKSLVLYLKINKSNFIDNDNLSKDITQKGWSFNKEVRVNPEIDIDSVIPIIKQAYDFQLT